MDDIITDTEQDMVGNENFDGEEVTNPVPENSILKSVKDSLPIPLEVTDFDSSILMHINSAIFSLNQLGLGPDDIFIVKDVYDTYNDLLGKNTKYMSVVSQYLYYKTYIAFDHTLTPNVTKTVSECIAELEQRILYMMENDSRKEVIHYYGNR